MTKALKQTTGAETGCGLEMVDLLEFPEDANLSPEERRKRLLAAFRPFEFKTQVTRSATAKRDKRSS